MKKEIIDIINKVKDDYNVTDADLVENRPRHPNTITARRIIMTVLKRFTKMTLDQIASIFGMRSDTVVYQAEVKINQLMDYDPEFETYWRKLTLNLTARL